MRRNQVHSTEGDPGGAAPLGTAYPSLPLLFTSGARTGYVRPDGALGFVKGGYVHQTDWAAGTVKTLGEVFAGLPADFQAGVDVMYMYPTGVPGFVKGGLVHHGDWAAGATKTIAELFPGLPADFNTGVDAAYMHPNGVLGFVKGGVVHHADWPTGYSLTLEQKFPSLPMGWTRGDRPITYLVRSAGTASRIQADEETLVPDNDLARGGLMVMVIDPADGQVLTSGWYAAQGGGPGADPFAELVEGVPAGRWVAVAACAPSDGPLDERVARACESLGSSAVRDLRPGDAWAMLGRRGLARGLARERTGTAPGAAEISGTFAPEADADPAAIRVTATAANRREASNVEVQETVVTPKRGMDDWTITVVVIDDATGVVDRVSGYEPVRSKDGKTDLTEAERFAADIEKLPPGKLVAIVDSHGAAKNFTERAHQACDSLGGKYSRQVRYAARWSLVGVKGSPPGTAAEAWGDGLGDSEISRYWHVLSHAGGPTPFALSVLSTGWVSRGPFDLSIGGLTPDELPMKDWQDTTGLHVVVIDEITGQLLGSRIFQTQSSAAEADAFAAYVEALPVGRLVVAGTRGSSAEKLTPRALRACESLGSGLIRQVTKDVAWALIGRKGCAPGAAAEVFASDGSTWVSLAAPIAMAEAGVARPFVVLDAGAVAGAPDTSLATTFNPEAVRLPDRRGALRAAMFDAVTGDVVDAQVFDLTAGGSASFAAWVKPLKDNRVVSVVLDPDAGSALTEDALRACESLGSGLVRKAAVGGAWSLVGRKGGRPDTVAESLAPTSVSSAYWLFPDIRNPGSGFSVSIRAGGDYTRISSLGATVPIAAGYGPGLNAVVLDEATGRTLSADRYDVVADPGAADRFAKLVEAAPPGRIIAVAAVGVDATALPDRALRAAELLGSGLIRTLTADCSWCMAGVRGFAPGSALERTRPSGTSALATWIPFPPRSLLPFIAAATAGLIVFTVGSIVALNKLTDVLHQPQAQALPPAPPPLPAGPRYDQGTVLVAHNAFNNTHDGAWPHDRQQNLSIPEQLRYGVRGLAIDIHRYTPPGGTQGLYLCHGWCVDNWWRPGLQLRTFAQMLTDVVPFLQANPNEIVTILIESEAGWNPNAAQNQLFVDALVSSGAMPYTFWPDPPVPAGGNMWNPAVNPGGGTAFTWPTVADMQARGTRLVFFVDRRNGDPPSIQHPLPFVWRYVRESDFGLQGNWEPGSPMAERGQSRGGQPTRTLNLLNHFATAPALTATTAVNRYNVMLGRVIDYANTFHAIPTFIEVDFVDEGDARRLVDNLNTHVWPAANPITEVANLPLDPATPPTTI
ncbi:MAG TPA: interleukin-like EMT inducer domain-containing protein [Streptosporangiaceae bacterium]